MAQGDGKKCHLTNTGLESKTTLAHGKQRCPKCLRLGPLELQVLQGQGTLLTNQQALGGNNLVQPAFQQGPLEGPWLFCMVPPQTYWEENPGITVHWAQESQWLSRE